MSANGDLTKLAGNGQEPEEQEQEGRRRGLIVFLLIPLLLGAICLWSFFANVTLSSAESFIPAGLHSSGLANYGPDEMQSPIRGLQIRIIEGVIRDRDPEAADADQRATDVVKALESPIPTVTPQPGAPTSTPRPTSTRTPTEPPATSAPTSAVSSTPSATPDGSQTPTPTASASHTPTPSRTPTNPPPGPTNTPSKTPTPGPSPTATPCKVKPVIQINAPIDGSTYTWADQLPGEARAYDPDNVDPDTCQPIGSYTADNGTGITKVEFKIEYVDGGDIVHEHTQFSKRYCAFTGISTCLTQSLGPPFEWPDDTPIESGLHKLWARALDDDVPAQWSEWVHVGFTVDVEPTPTPTPTPSSTPTPSNTPSPTPVVSCSMFSLSDFGDSSNDVWWTLTNGSPIDVTIIGVEVEWSLSGSLNKVKLDGSDIWNDGDSTSPASIASNWTGVSRLFAPGVSRELRLNFSNSVGGHSFSITVHFDNSCDVLASDTA